MTNPFLRHTFENIGGFEIARHMCLLQCEEEWFEGYETRKFEAGLVALEFKDNLAKSMGISGEAVMTLLERAQLGDTSASNAVLEHATDLRPIMAVKRLDETFIPSIATMAIQSRCSIAWLEAQAANLEEGLGIVLLSPEAMSAEFAALSAAKIEDLSIEEIERKDDLQTALSIGTVWVRSLTRKLPRSTVLKIATFMSGERREWKELSHIGGEPVDLGNSSPSTAPSSNEGTELTGMTATTQSKKQGFRTKSSGIRTGAVALPG